LRERHDQGRGRADDEGDGDERRAAKAARPERRFWPEPSTPAPCARSDADAAMAKVRRILTHSSATVVVRAPCNGPLRRRPRSPSLSSDMVHCKKGSRKRVRHIGPGLWQICTRVGLPRLGGQAQGSLLYTK
jgi:hypothetical protein